jgi:hypothetical protein
MKLTTTFWSEEKHDFTQLLYVNNHTKEVMFQTDLTNKFETHLFFKNIAKFVKSKEVRNTINHERVEGYQFAVSENNGEIIFIKWFDLVIDEKNIISHDIAFETTLITKNNVQIPFGRFPMRYKYNSLAKYREFNIKAQAYKYIANQI